MFFKILDFAVTDRPLTSLLFISLLSFCLCGQNNEPKNEITFEKIRSTNKKPHKILIVSCGRIGGHVSLTKGIVSLLKNHCEIDVIDCVNLMSKRNFALYGCCSYYQMVQKSRIVVSVLQTLAILGNQVMSKFPSSIYNLFYKFDEFKLKLRQNQYDLVIFTSPVHTSQINLECFKQKIPCVNVMTDYGEPEFLIPNCWPMWIRQENMVYLLPQNSYFKPSKKHASVAYISAIPIRPEFKVVRKKSKQDLKIKLGLDPTVPCVLIFFGAGGSDEMLEIAQVCKNDTTKKYMFLCGASEGVAARINAMHCPHFTVLGYVNNPAEYIRAADVLIGKLGGLSTTEAIACETPSISKNDMFSTLPAEKPNLRYVEDNGYGMSISNYDHLLSALDAVMNKKNVFPKNNGLDESVSVIRRMLRENKKGKWANRFYNV